MSRGGLPAERYFFRFWFRVGCYFTGELYSEGRAQDRKSMTTFWLYCPCNDSPAKERSRKQCLNKDRGELVLLRWEESLLPMFFTIDSLRILFTSSFLNNMANSST